MTAVESESRVFVGIVEGMPTGIPISRDYIDHQIQRLQKAHGLDAGVKVAPVAVEVLSGMKSGKTLGSPIALLIRNGSRHIPVEAIDVACCTIVRKLLEDFGIFIGSHVTRVGSVAVSDRSRIDEMILAFTKASCGAYKVTEQADLSSVRILDNAYEAPMLALVDMQKRVGRAMSGMFELLVTGVPAGLAGGMRTGGRLDELLAEALGSVPGVHSIKILSGFRGVEPFTLEARQGASRRAAKGNRRYGRASKVGATDGKLIVIKATTRARSTSDGDLASEKQGRRKAVKASAQDPSILTVPAASVLAEAVIAPVLANAFLEKFRGSSVTELRNQYRQSMRLVVS